jgi:excisionase family DNA binding protein
MKALLTTREAAAQLGITDSRIRQLIRAGRLPARRMGRDWFVDEGDLRAFQPAPRGWPKGISRSRRSP